jgi:hypothetical protein
MTKQRQVVCFVLIIFVIVMLPILSSLSSSLLSFNDNMTMNDTIYHQEQELKRSSSSRQRRQLVQDEKKSVPYNVIMTLSLQYLNNTVAEFIESFDQSNDIISHLCLTINTQVNFKKRKNEKNERIIV